jgi:uncharacterized membrane protein
VPRSWQLTLLAALLAAISYAASGRPPSLQAQSPQAQSQTKKPSTPPVGTPAAPAAPQSKHFPILLLAFGPASGASSAASAATTEPGWSIRIGQKGPERLDRPNYPPVMLEPVDVNREGTSDTWTYRAKDSATAAEVAVRLTREPCTADTSGTKYTFHAEAQHAQLGNFSGCAKIAAELFPRLGTQLEDDTEDEKKPPVPVPADVIKFRAPVAYAYLNPTGKVVFKRGAQTKVAAPEGAQLDVSNDGQRLLAAREEKGGDHTIVLYDFSTGKSTELLRGSVQSPYFSPDGTRLAFLKLVDSHWNLFVAPINAADSAAAVYTGDLFALHGWSDGHTLLAGNQAGLYWIGDDGRVQQTVTSNDLFGVGQFVVSPASGVRINPINPDVLAVSAEMLKPPPGTPTDPKAGTGAAIFVFEVRSKRRSLLSPPNTFATQPEWSRDGVQLFFTNRDSSRGLSIWRVFWDASQPKRYLPGSQFTVGQ